MSDTVFASFAGMTPDEIIAEYQRLWSLPYNPRRQLPTINDARRAVGMAAAPAA